MVIEKTAFKDNIYLKTDKLTSGYANTRHSHSQSFFSTWVSLLPLAFFSSELYIMSFNKDFYLGGPKL